MTLERSMPVVFQEPGKRAIREHAATGLAARAVVAFVLCVDDALDGGIADGTGFLETAMDGHLVTKRGDLFGEAAFQLATKMIDPYEERRSRRVVKTRDLLILHGLRQLER